MGSERSSALAQALEFAPDNHPLRLMLAETLRDEGDAEGATEQYDLLLAAGQLPRETLVPAGQLAVQAGELDVAARCLEAAQSSGVVEGVSALKSEIDQGLSEQGMLRLVRGGPGSDASPKAHNVLEAETKKTFADVGGLENVKKTVHRTIILPLQRPELYQKYGRRAGGGVMLYGPPGCGKTI